ncbi:MAG: SsrA-binding protein SmpB [Candidatus Liptonbacteria bacterium]|nr:SsrA-binding protein SmpB [Candidatus Liptonbacteria bacterium]
MQSLAENRRARFDYEILETLEAGIVLKGHEVKSVKSGRMGLSGSRVLLRGGEAYLIGAQIPPYQPLNVPETYDPTATRKLLLKIQEITHLIGVLREGTTLIPLRIYLKGNRIKLELAVARGKKKHDKRETLKKKTAAREMRRAISR